MRDSLVPCLLSQQAIVIDKRPCALWYFCVVLCALHKDERLCGLTGLPHLRPRCAQALLDAGFTVPKRACVADEHYVPTLLAVHGLDNQARAAPARSARPEHHPACQRRPPCFTLVARDGLRASAAHNPCTERAGGHTVRPWRVGPWPMTHAPCALTRRARRLQTDCLGTLTHADWAWPSWSPKTYHTFEVTFPLIARLRAHKWYAREPGAACDPAPSLASADAAFRRRGGARSLAARRPRPGVRARLGRIRGLAGVCSKPL